MIDLLRVAIGPDLAHLLQLSATLARWSSSGTEKCKIREIFLDEERLEVRDRRGGVKEGMILFLSDAPIIQKVVIHYSC